MVIYYCLKSFGRINITPSRGRETPEEMVRGYSQRAGTTTFACREESFGSRQHFRIREHGI